MHDVPVKQKSIMICRRCWIAIVFDLYRRANLLQNHERKQTPLSKNRGGHGLLVHSVYSSVCSANHGNSNIAARVLTCFLVDIGYDPHGGNDRGLLHGVIDNVLTNVRRVREQTEKCEFPSSQGQTHEVQAGTPLYRLVEGVEGARVLFTSRPLRQAEHKLSFSVREMANA